MRYKKTIIVALAVFYNRKELTLKSLKSVFDQVLPAGVSLEVVMVDDGSSDGTTEAIKKEFPAVSILTGNGELYWNQGMIFGWNAIKNRAFDYLMPFNDDIVLNNNAVQELLTCIEFENGNNTIVSGAMYDPIRSLTSYGGKERTSKLFPLRFRTVKPTGYCKAVDTINMNCVLIPQAILRRIGFLSNKFKHSCGDFEYGIRHLLNGGELKLSPEHVGICHLHDRVSFKESISLSRKLSLYRKNYPFHERFNYYRSYGGKYWALGLFAFYVSFFLRNK